MFSHIIHKKKKKKLKNENIIKNLIIFSSLSIKNEFWHKTYVPSGQRKKVVQNFDFKNL